MRLRQILFLLLFSLSVLFISCSEEEPEANLKDEQSVTYVRTEKVEFQNYVDYITLIGTAKAEKSAEISSEEGGRIKRILKDKGNYVSAGQVIVEMENDVLKASMEAAKAQYDMAENNFIKQEKIYNERVTSELQYLNAKYERDAAKANYDLIKSRYEKTFIKAPFSGIIDEKFQEIGENVLPGQPIVSLVQVDRIKIVAGVPENFVNQVKQGGKTKLIFEDLDNLEMMETISYVGNTISTSNRTFPIEIMVNNSNRRIKPELNVKVLIQRENIQDAILVPEEVIQRTDFGYVVFVEKDGIAEMRTVDVISRSNNYAAIRNGLDQGDNLVVVGFQNLVNGEKVKVVTEETE